MIQYGKQQITHLGLHLQYVRLFRNLLIRDCQVKRWTAAIRCYSPSCTTYLSHPLHSKWRKILKSLIQNTISHEIHYTFISFFCFESEFFYFLLTRSELSRLTLACIKYLRNLISTHWRLYVNLRNDFPLT